MTDNRDFENKLHDEIMKEAENIPESLSPENITSLVANKQPQKAKSKVGKIIAMAASFAIVLVAAFIGIRYYKPAVKPIETDNQPVVVAGENDYSGIQTFFIDLKNSTMHASLGETYTINKFFSLGGAKASDTTDDAAVVNENSATAPSSAANTAGVEGDGDGLGGGPASETEVQVQGVDEADIIKNDGKYLYVIHRDKSDVVTIIDPSNPSDMKVLSEIKLVSDDGYDASADEIYIKGDRLIVAANLYTNENNPIYFKFDSICCFYGSGETRTGVQIYDISDRANPKLVSSYSVEGGYVSSRMIGNEMVLISNYLVPLYNDDETLKNECIPSYWYNSKEYKVPADKINILENNEENTYINVLKFDVTADSEEPDVASVLGGSDNVYCNATDLYLARWNYVATRDSYDEYTEIFRFDITDGVKYVKSVKIEGGILNQFSMDEYNGYFRIATCHRNEQSIITVLDKDFNQVGKLGGIAKGESIYAVRFMGNTAYVVTFFRTDPLFVIDLSDPTKPSVVGELKIPGFSSMLYPYGENYLIGIGVDGDEDGTNGNLKVSLFDVSDPKAPKEISKAIINGYADTPAAYIHKAFLRFGDTGEFAIPVNGDGSNYLCSFKVEDNKISAYKKYVCDNENSYYAYMERGAYIGNTVFTLSNLGLTAFDRDSCEILSEIEMRSEDEIVVYNTYDDYAVVTEPDEANVIIVD